VREDITFCCTILVVNEFTTKSGHLENASNINRDKTYDSYVSISYTSGDI